MLLIQGLILHKSIDFSMIWIYPNIANNKKLILKPIERYIFILGYVGIKNPSIQRKGYFWLIMEHLI